MRPRVQREPDRSALSVVQPLCDRIATATLDDLSDGWDLGAEAVIHLEA